ncbi:MAG: sulfatase [Paludibacter sp.]|nr:sulfatase [Paludibacter sp.]
MKKSNGLHGKLYRGIGVSLLLLHGSPMTGETKRPNVLFILTDDQRWDEFGYAGNKVIQTPEMDKLAREGICFRNAFITTPISGASRASILTGVRERTSGYVMGAKVPATPYMNRSYPAVLHENGYYTGFFGKLGIRYKELSSIFNESDSYDRDDKQPNRKGYYYKTIGNDTVHLTTYTGYQAREFIKGAPAAKPFCLSLSFSAPHAHDPSKEQYFWDKEYDHLYEDVTIAPPLLGEDQYFNALPKEVREGFNRVRWYWRYDTPEKYQHSVKGYYRMISQVDHEIGLIRKALEEKGVADNTVIIFMGDNGYFLGERQLAGKWLMYENSLRVPMIVYDPRCNKHKDIDSPVLNIDIPVTILDLAAAPVPNHYQGLSLCDYYVKGRKPVHRKAILFEHLWEKKEIPSSEAIRTDRWKYFRYRFIDTPEELYDLKKDPLEINNLALNPAYKNVVDKLRKECDAQVMKYTQASLIK